MSVAGGGGIVDAVKAAAMAFAMPYIWDSVGTALQTAGVIAAEIGHAATAVIKGAVHGVIGGAAAVAQGGSFLHGFAANAIGAAAGVVSDAVSMGNDILDTTIVAAAGCAGAVFSGGKCANGAVTAAFANMYNKWEGLHIALEGAGLLPGAGIVPDLLNAGVYALKGEWGLAAVSLGAAVPVLGQGVTAGKLASKFGPTYGDLRKAGLADGHHVIQDAAVRDLPGYSRAGAPAVQLSGPSTAVGSAHYSATQVQRQSGGGTYAAERRIGYKALRSGGLSASDARSAIERADGYFGSIGVGPGTVTRRPGNRRR